MKKLSVKWLWIISFPVIVASCTGCSAINKVYWDHKVDELCEKDGGVIIYEKAVISKSDYPNIKLASNGEVILPPEKTAGPEDPYFIRFESEYLREGSLSVARSITSIVRNSDKKTMSSLVTYGRSGGDFLPEGIAYPSHYSCDNKQENLKNLGSTISINE